MDESIYDDVASPNPDERIWTRKNTKTQKLKGIVPDVE